MRRIREVRPRARARAPWPSLARIAQPSVLAVMAEAAVVSLLNASLDADARTREQGEAGLAAFAQQPGYGLALAQVATSAELPGGTKQLAAVVLKKFVKASERAPPLRTRASQPSPSRSTGRWARSTSPPRWLERRRRLPSERCCPAAWPTPPRCSARRWPWLSPPSPPLTGPRPGRRSPPCSCPPSGSGRARTRVRAAAPAAPLR